MNLKQWLSLLFLLLLLCSSISWTGSYRQPSPLPPDLQESWDRDIEGDSDQVLRVNCSNPLMGQYVCSSPSIDPTTQQPVGCGKDNKAPVNCTLREGLVCMAGTQGLGQGRGQRQSEERKRFVAWVSCSWTNGYSFETTLLLSIFLGVFGVDRFYLGYAGLGLLKFSTLGFLFFGQLVDILLIAMQIVKPADGSSYVIKYFGPKLTILSKDNMSFVVPRDDWYREVG